jgi:light-regulated signal transduction histidine kinase (bacteriophytochrome)
MQLTSTVAQLKQKNQELDQFVYAASHDLKAPLRAISNYSDFLQEDLGESLDGEQKRYLAGLKTAAGQGQALIKDLLDYSRVGRTEVKAEKIDMPAMINEVKAYLNLASDIDLTVQKDWPALESDHLLLMQILKNLVGNAVKFNHRASKRVDIGWRQPDKNGSIEIFVRDNGIGIDPHYQQRVFGIFQRLHTDKEFEGTGIGLAVVKKAAQELGGTVRVESAPGQGSTFYVAIPARMAEYRDQTTEDPPSSRLQRDFAAAGREQKTEDRG